MHSCSATVVCAALLLLCLGIVSASDDVETRDSTNRTRHGLIEAPTNGFVSHNGNLLLSLASERYSSLMLSVDGILIHRDLDVAQFQLLGLPLGAHKVTLTARNDSHWQQCQGKWEGAAWQCFGGSDVSSSDAGNSNVVPDNHSAAVDKHAWGSIEVRVEHNNGASQLPLGMTSCNITELGSQNLGLFNGWQSSGAGMFAGVVVPIIFGEACDSFSVTATGPAPLVFAVNASDESQGNRSCHGYLTAAIAGEYNLIVSMGACSDVIPMIVQAHFETDPSATIVSMTSNNSGHDAWNSTTTIGELVFWIASHDSYGNRRNTTQDDYYVGIRGPAAVLPSFNAVGNGLYSSFAFISETGDYNVSVSLNRDNFDSGQVGAVAWPWTVPTTCWPTARGHVTGSPFPLNVQASPKRLLQPIASPTGGVRMSDIDVADDPDREHEKLWSQGMGECEYDSDIWPGRWVRNQECDSIGDCFIGVDGMDWRQHPYVLKKGLPYIWVPYKCKLRYFAPPQARSMLRGRWLLFLGDSTIQELANMLMATCLQDKENDINTLDWRHADSKACPSAAYHQRRFDTGYAPQGVLEEFDIRITFHWIGPTPCDNCVGLPVFESAEFLSTLQEEVAFDEERQNREPPQSPRPDVAVFNSALHDFCRDKFSYAAYTDMLHPALSFVESIADRVIWKTIAPKFGDYKECGPYYGGEGHAGVGSTGVKVANRIATPIARDAGFSIMEWWEMAYPWPEYIQWHHCGEVAASLNYDGIGYPCFIISQVFLNMLSLPPRPSPSMNCQDQSCKNAQFSNEPLDKDEELVTVDQEGLEVELTVDVDDHDMFEDDNDDFHEHNHVWSESPSDDDHDYIPDDGDDAGNQEGLPNPVPVPESSVIHGADVMSEPTPETTLVMNGVNMAQMECDDVAALVSAEQPTVSDPQADVSDVAFIDADNVELGEESSAAMSADEIEAMMVAEMSRLSSQTLDNE